MKPVDLARRLRRDAAFEPAALARGKGGAHGGSAAGGRARAPDRRSFPRLPYEDIRAALAFLERGSGSARSRPRGG